MILGITGPIGHGKSSLGEAILAAAGGGKRLESSMVIMEVANELRAETIEHPKSTDLKSINNWLAQLEPIIRKRMQVDVPDGTFVITKEKLAANTPLYAKLFEYLSFIEQWPRFAEAEINNENKYRFRSLLQWIGGFCVLTIHPTIWWDELIRRAEADPENKLTVLSGMRFPAEADRVREVGGVIISVDRPEFTITDSKDVTERDRNNITFNVIVHNDGNLEQLGTLGAKLWRDLQKRNLKKRYSARRLA